MTCRAPTSATCTNSPATGQTLTYDALRRLVGWSDGSSSSEQYAYDGEGTRGWRQTVSGSTTTTTVSILGVEDVTSVSGGATTTTRYYRLPGGVTATRDSSGLVYEASDQLGTPIAALNLATGIVGEQLRAPYGQARYAATGTGSTGGMRTPFGFTGQREDTTPTGSSGLDDFHARMYDAETGRFTSADDMQPGLGDPSGMDGYAYVGGRVENATDPSGQTEADTELEDAAINAGTPVTPDIPDAFYAAFDGDPAFDLTAANVPNTATTTDPGGDVTFYTLEPDSSLQIDTYTPSGQLITGRSVTSSDTDYKTMLGQYNAAAAPPTDDVKPINRKTPKPTTSKPKHNKTNPTGVIQPTLPGMGGNGTGGGGGSGSNSIGSGCGCPDGVFKVYLSSGRWPEATNHIVDARNAGKPWVLTRAPRATHGPRRNQLLRALGAYNWPHSPDQEPDEYPPASTVQGGIQPDGSMASVRWIDVGQNAGAGASMGRQLNLGGIGDGDPFCIEIIP